MKWQKQDPKKAEEQSLKQLKYLIAKNLTKDKTQKQMEATKQTVTEIELTEDVSHLTSTYNLKQNYYHTNMSTPGLLETHINVLEKNTPH